MKLRSRLLLLVGSACFLFLCSIAASFLIQSPLGAMEAEGKVYEEVDRAAANFQVAANRLAVDALGPAQTNYEAAQQRWTAALQGLDGIRLLPQASPDLAAAVDSVRKLGALSATGQTAVANALVPLVAQVVAEGVNPATSSWSRLSRLADLNQVKNPLVLSALLGGVITQVGKLNTSLDTTRAVIRKNDAVIQNGLATIRERSTLAGVVGMAAALVLALVVSWFVARNLAQSMGRIGTLVATVAAGDLRVRFGGRRKDELGELARNIDVLLESLNQAFRRIQAASSDNIEVKDQLSRSVADATSAAVQIESNSVSILAQLQKVDERISGSEADLAGVMALLQAFGVRMDLESASITEAGAAVGALVSAVVQVSSLSEENRRQVETLLLASDEGRELFLASFAKVAEIDESVAEIQDMVSTIAEIAGQTNILALNAAIEAAHAGESGKGFAVVADEISQLAAASATSSRQIAGTTQGIVAKIREASGTREATLRAFEAIGLQVGNVAQRSQGIDREVTAMSSGTDKIRTVMTSLTESSAETVKESTRINTMAASLGEALGQVGRISHEVVANIGEITQGLGEISHTVTEVAVQADRLGRIGDALEQAVQAFSTEGSPAAG
jgi:methyl-accepting chemotaxis protein